MYANSKTLLSSVLREAHTVEQEAAPWRERLAELKKAQRVEPFVFDAEPSTSVQVLCEWPGWWCSPEKDQLLQGMAREPDPRKRLGMWERVQALFYEDAARIKLGDYFRLDARRAEVQGYQPGPYMHFWNVWLDRK